MQEEKLYHYFRLGSWNFESICAWLSSLSKKGFILRRVHGHRYTFAKNELGELEYHIEYLSANINETLNYTQLCGWNYVCSDGYLHYFYCRKGEHYYTGAFYKRTYYDERKRFFTSLLVSNILSVGICLASIILIILRLSSPITYALLGLVVLLALYCVLSLINNLSALQGINRRLSVLPKCSPPSKTAFLTVPSNDYDRSFLDACLAYKKAGGLLYDVSTMPEARNMIKRLVSASQPDEEEVFEPFYTYWLIDNGQYIGSANLRLVLSEEQKRCGGNIAYEIRPEMRLKGYGTIILSKMLGIAAEKGLTSVLLTCEADNISAVNTIENCGGKLINVHVINREGNVRPTRIYSINLHTAAE